MRRFRRKLRRLEERLANPLPAEIERSLATRALAKILGLGEIAEGMHAAMTAEAERQGIIHGASRIVGLNPKEERILRERLERRRVSDAEEDDVIDLERGADGVYAPRRAAR